MKQLHLEEKIEQINNAVKNLTLLLNQMSQSIQRISTQVAGTPPPPPPNGKKIPWKDIAIGSGIALAAILIVKMGRR